MRFNILIALLLLSTIGFTQSSIKMPLPGFSSTYAYGSAVRGFCFQAPVNFTVVGLRVPDETKFGLQNVAIYELSAKPSNTIPKASEMLFYSTGKASSQVLTCKVPITANKWFCVLGMCGNSTMSNNSYGTGPFQSSIAGGPQVTLSRLYMNSNLISSGGIGAMTMTPTGSIGRVEVYVEPQAFAKVEDYGMGSSAVPVMGNVKLAQSTFSRTYSGLYTRGFYFRVPSPLTITGWEVPDEAKNGTMNVAIYRLATAPPVYTASVAGNPVYFKSGAKSGAPVTLTTPINFKTGEYIGVLGACGASASSPLLNSYGGTSPAQAKIGNSSVSLHRLIMQASILANSGVGNISANPGGMLGRIFLYLKDITVPDMTTGVMPTIGTTATLLMQANLPDGLAGGVIFGLGRVNVPLPLGTLLVSAPIVGVYPLPGGTGKFQLPIPNDPALLGGGPLNFQGFVLTIGNFGLTNGVEWYIGK